ncbi:hypothetical protein [Pontibacter chinhatensis]|uniref:Uncharacterized protein n=1 Tax=Pontibacter chinhatensis TaxID=1436961 RepID=A0A1I2ZN98_9BACT|nr:hypothetical protein [Pontibacter chinhatensis]SFH38989.1 hypothetical protein SAMN05421739_1169 [Pontibacter chinhatensis]
MRVILYIFLLFFLNRVVIAQDESVFNRINGIKFENNIYLKWDSNKNGNKGALRYSIENPYEWHDLDEDLIFNVRNQHRNNFKIYTEFYNPLKFSIKSTSKDLDDPAYQAISEFISNLPASTAVVASSLQPNFAPTTFITKDGTNLTEIKKTILLNEWVYEFIKALDIDSVSKYSGGYNVLAEKINLITQADDYFFNDFIANNIPELINNQYTYTGWIKKRSEVLFNVDNNYTTFRQELGISTKVNENLKSKQENAIKSIDKLIQLLSTEFDSEISKFIVPSRKEAFKKYSSSTAFLLSNNKKTMLEESNIALKGYTELLDKLTAHTNKFTKEICDMQGKNCNNYHEDYDLKLDWKSQKMKEFNYKVTALDISGSEVENSNYNASFVVGKKHRLYPYISTGLLYTGFSYPNYSITTENGKNEVAIVGETKVNLRPAMFLNFLFTNWDNILPFMQLGVSTGVNDAIFPIGAGVSVGRSFSISGGTMFGYRKELDNLKLGGEVRDEAQLQSDLTNKPVFSWYFSVSYNLSKK